MAEKSSKRLFQSLVIQYFRLITGVLIILILLIGYFVLIGPQYNSLKEKGILNYQAQREKLANRKAYLDKLKELQAKYAQLNTKDLESLSYFLPVGEDIPGLFVQAEALAKDNGLVLQNIGVNQPAVSSDKAGITVKKESAGIGTLSLVMTLTGGSGYGGLKSFLDSLEKNVRLFDVESVNFSPDGQNYSVNAKTYYLTQSQ